MEGRLSGIPRRVGGRSSSTGNDSNFFAPGTSYGSAQDSNRLSRPMSKLSMDPVKRSITRSKSSSGCAPWMSPCTPLLKKSIPFPVLGDTPGTARRNRTPSQERRSNWKANLDRALAGTTVKDRRTINDPGWQRGQLNRLQAYFIERTSEGEASGFTQQPIQRPLKIATFVELIKQLLAPNVTCELNTGNYVSKLPVIVKKLLYPGHVAKSWLQAVNAMHSFPHALALMAYLMDLNIKIEEQVEDWIFLHCDQVSYLRHTYVRKTWQDFQETNDFKKVTKEYIDNLKKAFNVSEEEKEKLEMEVKLKRESLCSPSLIAERLAEQQKITAVAQVKNSLKEMESEQVVQFNHNQAILNSFNEEQLKLEKINQEISNQKEKQNALKESLRTQTMSVEERDKILDNVDYSNRVMDAKLNMIATIEKKITEVNKDLSRAQNNTMMYCVKFNEKLITLENVDEKAVEVNQFIIEERELVEPSTVSKVDQGCKWFEDRKRDIIERIKTVEAEKFAASQRKSSNIGEIKKLRIQLEETRQALMIEEKKLSEQHKQHNEGLEVLQSKIALMKSKAQSRVDEANAINAKLDIELKHWQEEIRMWNVKLTTLKNQAEKRIISMGKKTEIAKNKRKTKVLEIIEGWKQMLPKKK